MIHMLMIALFLMFSNCNAITISNCYYPQVVELEEDRGNRIFCEGFSANDTVIWQILTDPPGSQSMNVGQCGPSDASCTSTNADVALSRSNTSSEMTILRNHRNFGGKKVQCTVGSSSYICNIRVIRLGQPSPCKVFLDSDGQTVSGSCLIDKTFSSNDSYDCVWYNTYPGNVGRQEINTVFILTEYEEAGQRFFRAACAFSLSISAEGRYEFFITFTPGPVQQYANELNVSNGPSPNETKSSIAQPLPFITNGTKILTLTCHSNQAAPMSTYSWTGPNCTPKMPCTFTPRVHDADMIVMCTGEFSKSGGVVSASFRLILNPDIISTTTAPGATTTTTTSSDSHHETSLLSTSPKLMTSTAQQSSSGQDEANSDRSSTTESKHEIAAIAGGVGGGVAVIILVVIVIVLIIRRRKGSQKTAREENEVEEHTNVLYEASDSPYEVNDGYQPTNQIPIGIATIFDSAYDDHNLNTNNKDDHAHGYVSLSTDTARPHSYQVGTGNIAQADPEPSVEPDQYSALDDPSTTTSAVSSAPVPHGDVPAVVDKSRQGKAKSEVQPDMYARVDKSRSHQGEDVYAVVDKSAKRAVSAPPQQHIALSEDGTYAEVQTPRTDTKPNPVLKPKPPLKPKLGSTSSASEASSGGDEYNVLNFHGGNSGASAEQYYSHITRL